MVRILAATVDLEGVPDADRLLTIPGRVVQPRRRQGGVARRHRRQVHVAVRVALHRRRVRGTRTSVAANESARDGNEKVNGGITAEWRDIWYDSDPVKKSLFVPRRALQGALCYARDTVKQKYGDLGLNVIRQVLQV